MNPTILIAALCLAAAIGARIRSGAVIATKVSAALAGFVLLAQVLSMLLRMGGQADAGRVADLTLVALHVAWAAATAYGIAAAIRSSNGAALSLATWSTALLIAGKFLLFEVGKIRHNQEMEQFFLYSGYPAVMHYVVMAVEVAGSLALLFFARRRLGMVAAAGLGLVMAGAVATHWHNGDPLSDSYDAIAQAIYIGTYLTAAGLTMRLIGRTAEDGYAR